MLEYVPLELVFRASTLLSKASFDDMAMVNDAVDRPIDLVVCWL
jgi:hypothetical protein